MKIPPLLTRAREEYLILDCFQCAFLSSTFSHSCKNSSKTHLSKSTSVGKRQLVLAAKKVGD